MTAWIHISGKHLYDFFWILVICKTAWSYLLGKHLYALVHVSRRRAQTPAEQFSDNAFLFLAQIWMFTWAERTHARTCATHTHTHTHTLKHTPSRTHTLTDTFPFTQHKSYSTGELIASCTFSPSHWCILAQKVQKEIEAHGNFKQFNEVHTRTHTHSRTHAQNRRSHLTSLLHTSAVAFEQQYNTTHLDTIALHTS